MPTIRPGIVVPGLLLELGLRPPSRVWHQRGGTFFSGGSMEYFWAVPISSESPHLAHLIPADDQLITHRFCDKSKIVNREFAVAVDSLLYRHKCMECTIQYQRTPDAYITLIARPDLIKGKDVTRVQEMIL